MADPWSLLVDSGLPDGAARPAPASGIDGPAVRAAVVSVLAAERLPVAKVAPLLAFLRAWRHHWAPSFRRVFGTDGDAAIAKLDARLDDRNRYLKLRRIAIANLAGVL